jgi:hypothetical protein
MSRLTKSDSSTSWYAFAITPDDSSELAHVVRAIYVGGGGDVAIVCEDNASPVTFVAVPAGQILPVRVRKVLSTGTTATDIVGLV